MSDGRCIAIVPCSGIGKPFGSVTREAAYELCEELRPERTRLVALSKLVLGDEAARNAVTRNGVVTIDGCAQMCASKMVKQCGGRIVREATAFEAFRRHRELKPEGIAELNEAGKQLARALAGEIVETVIDSPEASKGEDHA
jgi:uncharacterized metal-binding protein